MKIIIFAIFTIINFQTFAYQVSGVVETIDDSKVKIRTAQEDVTFDITKIDPVTKAILSATKSKKERQIYQMSEDSILNKTPIATGVRRNCSELPINVDELKNIANQSSGTIDFLEKIPKGVLQNFTFVTNSLSLHRGKKDKDGDGQVSPMWPRVLRTSVDGKLTISFVCDPKNPTFSKIEILHFDDEVQEFKTLEFDFGNVSPITNMPENPIHDNPVSCISCHSATPVNGKTSLKPNWGEYFRWSDCENDRGIQLYGGNDDRMVGEVRLSFSQKNYGCNSKKDKIQTKQENENYLNFRKMQKNNACFNTLPWTNEKSSFFDFKSAANIFPYSMMEGNDINLLSKRPNLHFTNAYSLLMAKRNFALLKTNPYFDKIKYLLLMEQAACEISKDEINQINSLIPNLNASPANFSGTSSAFYEKSLLSNFSNYTGFKPKDWNMNFKEQGEETETAYNTGLPAPNGSVSISVSLQNILGGEILKNISENNPTISSFKKARMGRAFEQDYGSQYSCLDDVGGSVIIADSSNDKLLNDGFCETLRKENQLNLQKLKNISSTCDNCQKLNTPDENKTLDDSIEKIVSKLSADQIDRGKKLIEADSKGKCVTCHSASEDLLPKNFRFIPSEKDKNKAESLAIIKARRNEIVGKIENRLIKTKSMPPMANELTDQDREDVKAYLLSLIPGK